MLEVNQLDRYYGNFKAVDNIHFTIGKGEIVGLLGHNGAGKTTIMKMLSGYLEPNQGTITISGIDLKQNPKQAQKSLGYLPENLPIYPEMTVADYLDYTAEIKGLVKNVKTSEIKRAIRATDIVSTLLAPIATLSRGYQQRVGVAQAILGKPRLLILDEPTNGLDPTQTRQMRNLIRDLSKDATVILSTHIMQEVDALCDRALIIRNGQLAVDARLEDLRQSNHLCLSTSMDTGLAESSLGTLEGVAQIEALPSQQKSASSQPVFRYQLRVSENCNALQISSAVARQVIQAGAELYAITETHRDLETLFREVNEAPVETHEKEVKDAA